MVQTVGIDLRVKFDNEVRSFIKLLANESNSKSPIRVERPAGSINDILNKYVSLGQKSLSQEGVRSLRAKAIAKYTFEKLLEGIIDDVQNQI